MVQRVPVSVWQFIAKLLLVLWLSYTLAQLVWMLFPAPETPPARVAANALETDRGGAGGRSVDIAELSSLNIFGQVAEGDQLDEMDDLADSGPRGGAGIEDEAVDTELNLVLRGIMGSSEEDAGRAIIADGSSQALYGVGDELPVRGNVTLEKVLPLRVILNNSGRYESLWLYTDSDFAENLASTRPVPDTPSRSWDGESEEDTADSPQQDDNAEAEQLPPQQEEELEEAADEVAQRMGGQSLSDVVSMSIHREGGQIVGYRIRPGRDQAMFDSLGLESGDIVKAVNGVELSSPQRVMEIYRDMGDAQSASLLIERGGQELSVDIDLQ